MRRHHGPDTARRSHRPQQGPLRGPCRARVPAPDGRLPRDAPGQRGHPGPGDIRVPQHRSHTAARYRARTPVPGTVLGRGEGRRLQRAHPASRGRRAGPDPRRLRLSLHHRPPARPDRPAHRGGSSGPGAVRRGGRTRAALRLGASALHPRGRAAVPVRHHAGRPAWLPAPAGEIPAGGALRPAHGGPLRAPYPGPARGIARAGAAARPGRARGRGHEGGLGPRPPGEVRDQLLLRRRHPGHRGPPAGPAPRVFHRAHHAPGPIPGRGG